MEELVCKGNSNHCLLTALCRATHIWHVPTVCNWGYYRFHYLHMCVFWYSLCIGWQNSTHILTKFLTLVLVWYIMQFTEQELQNTNGTTTSVVQKLLRLMYKPKMPKGSCVHQLSCLASRLLKLKHFFVCKSLHSHLLVTDRHTWGNLNRWKLGKKWLEFLVLQVCQSPYKNK